MADKNSVTDASGATELLLGILTLLADDRERRIRESKESNTSPRTELLLSSAGLSNELIARALHKNVDAVRMAISRAKKPTKKAASHADKDD